MNNFWLFERMFGKAACSACGQIIAANEFVMRTTSPLTQQQQQQQSTQQQADSPKFQNQIDHHVFHLKCFACSKCSSQLRPGDKLVYILWNFTNSPIFIFF